MRATNEETTKAAQRIFNMMTRIPHTTEKRKGDTPYQNRLAIDCKVADLKEAREMREVYDQPTNEDK